MNHPSETDVEQVLLNLIVDRLGTEERLPSEKHLATTLGVSRASIREMLHKFEASGVVESMHGSGWYAKLPDISSVIMNGWGLLLKVKPDLLIHLLDVRLALELGFIERAIQTLTLDDIRYLKALADRMELLASNGEVFIEEDREFHRVLYSRVGNVLLEQLMKAFWGLFELNKGSALTRSEHLRESAAIHQELLAAIVAKNSEESKKLILKQFEDVVYRLKNTKLWVQDKEGVISK